MEESVKLISFAEFAANCFNNKSYDIARKYDILLAIRREGAGWTEFVTQTPDYIKLQEDMINNWIDNNPIKVEDDEESDDEKDNIPC